MRLRGLLSPSYTAGLAPCTAPYASVLRALMSLLVGPSPQCPRCNSPPRRPHAVYNGRASGHCMYHDHSPCHWPARLGGRSRPPRRPHCIRGFAPTAAAVAPFTFPWGPRCGVSLLYAVSGGGHGHLLALFRPQRLSLFCLLRRPSASPCAHGHFPCSSCWARSPSGCGGDGDSGGSGAGERAGGRLDRWSTRFPMQAPSNHRATTAFTMVSVVPPPSGACAPCVSSHGCSVLPPTCLPGLPPSTILSGGRGGGAGGFAADPVGAPSPPRVWGYLTGRLASGAPGISLL